MSKTLNHVHKAGPDSAGSLSCTVSALDQRVVLSTHDHRVVKTTRGQRVILSTLDQRVVLSIHT